MTLWLLGSACTVALASRMLTNFFFGAKHVYCFRALVVSSSLRGDLVVYTRRTSSLAKKRKELKPVDKPQLAAMQRDYARPAPGVRLCADRPFCICVCVSARALSAIVWLLRSSDVLDYAFAVLAAKPLWFVCNYV